MRGNRVNPPLQLKLPQSIANDRDLKKAFDDLTRVVDQLWRRTGAGEDYIQNARLQKLYNYSVSDKQDQQQVNINNNITKTESVNIQTKLTKQSTVNLINNQQKTNNIQLNVKKSEDYTEKLVITNEDFTTTESMTVICNNDLTDININLNSTPEDNEIVFIKKIGSKNVSVNSTKTIDGLTTQLINVLNESLMMRYIGKLDKWLIT